jgi:hypothetical protein
MSLQGDCNLEKGDCSRALSGPDVGGHEMSAASFSIGFGRYETRDRGSYSLLRKEVCTASSQFDVIIFRISSTACAGCSAASAVDDGGSR